MEIAVLADIHGNYEAFITCIEYCKKRNINEYIFLGDYLGEFAYPKRTMDLLYELNKDYKCTFVRGNKEEYWVNKEAWSFDKWKEKDSTTGCLYYVYNELSNMDIEFFSKMEIAYTLEYAGMEPITVCHGSPFSNREKLIPDDEKTETILNKCDNNVILCGHTHKQYMIEHGNKKVYNPGAVGVALNSGGKTQFAILKAQESKWDMEYISLQYDVEKVVKEQIESGLDKKAPFWWKFVYHLLHGSMYPMGQVMRRVMAYCKEKEGKCIWPEIPEEYWQKVYEEFFGKECIVSRDVFEAKREEGFPVTLETNQIHQSKWMELLCDKVQMPNGSIIDTYYKVHIPNESVGVVIVNEKEEILLIESKRYTTQRFEWEIPAGAIEPGECAEQAARRECMEETGLSICSLEYMGCNHPCNGLNDVQIHFYIAKVAGKVSEYDINEVEKRKWVSKEAVLKMIKNNETKSGISAYALLQSITFYL